MRFLMVCLCLLCSSAAVGQEVIVSRPRSVVVTAQDHAVVLARRGALVHSGCGQWEGIGCGSTPDAARRACCFYGRRPIVDEGVAFSPLTRRWYAVIRYR